MGLLAPWFLAGIAALAVPFYVHLLRRHTTTPRPFSSLMFFERRTQSSIKHRRLRYLLLLSLRALLLAAARPGVCESVHQSHGREHEQRKTAAAGDRQFLQHARRNAPGRREARGAFRAFFAKAGGQRAGDGARFADSSADAAVARCGRAARRRRERAAGRFARQLRRTRARACVRSRNRCTRPSSCIFSATCKNPRCPASFSELALPANVSLVLHPVAKESVPNWTVESVNAPGQVWDPKKARVQAVIAGFGTPAATRTVSLVVNGKTAATKTVDVPANGRATVEFQSLDVPYGFTRCEVRIDSADTFPADDVSLFAVERSDPRRALFVSDAGDSRSPLYFRSALGSAAESAFTLDTVSAGEAAESAALEVRVRRPFRLDLGSRAV